MEHNLFRVMFKVNLFAFLVLLPSRFLANQVGSNSLNVDKLLAITNSVTTIQHFLNQGVMDGSSKSVLPFLQQFRSGLGDVVNHMKQDGMQEQHGVSDVCLNHTTLILEELIRRQGWAMQMIDSLGKPGSGILDGNVQWLGSYDQCVQTEAKLVIGEDKTNSTTPVHVFNGRYCLAKFPLMSDKSSFLPIPLSIGVCVPDSCDDNSVRALLQTAAGYLFGNSSSAVSDVVCHKKIEYDASAIAVTVVLCTLLAALVIGTLYDVITQPGRNSVSSNPKLEEENGTIANFTHEQEKPEKTKQWQGKLGQLFLSFSVHTNGKKLLSTKQASGALTSINGIRFLSMAWVILGHTCSASAVILRNLKQVIDVKSHQWSFMAISNATLSVDSFFLLSGLLVSYLTLREIKKMGGIKKFRWGMFYFHRFWRLTPPYMLLLLTNVTLLKYWLDGPLWNQDGFDTEACKTSWWTNLLYINNLVHTDKLCMSWSWYLANDMQFFVLSPLIVIPLYLSPIAGTVVCIMFLAATTVPPGLISYAHNYPPDIPHFGRAGDDNDIFAKVYIKPYCRMGPYMIGLITGYILYRTECRVKINKVLNLLGWTVATGLCLTVLYGIYNPDNTHPLSRELASVYTATFRTAWGIGVAWVVIACATGNGGIINSILSWRAFIPLSRLTYCAYLVHPIVFYVSFEDLRTTLHLTDILLVFLFAGNLVISYAVAYFVSLAFESPMMGLEKVILKREKRQ